MNYAQPPPPSPRDAAVVVFVFFPRPPRHPLERERAPPRSRRSCRRHARGCQRRREHEEYKDDKRRGCERSSRSSVPRQPLPALEAPRSPRGVQPRSSRVEDPAVRRRRPALREGDQDQRRRDGVDQGHCRGGRQGGPGRNGFRKNASGKAVAGDRRRGEVFGLRALRQEVQGWGGRGARGRCDGATDSPWPLGSAPPEEETGLRSGGHACADESLSHHHS